MIAALIFMISLAALLQFFVSYCRSVIAAYGKQELSEQGLELAGIKGRKVCGEDFRRLLGLIGLCPGPGNDRSDIRAVRAYYDLLRMLGVASGKLVPAAAFWTERERASCAYFAAVALDRRITYSRDLMARQIANQF